MLSVRGLLRSRRLFQRPWFRFFVVGNFWNLSDQFFNDVFVFPLGTIASEHFLLFDRFAFFQYEFIFDVIHDQTFLYARHIDRVFLLSDLFVDNRFCTSFQ